eukprot:CAMPEP_0168789840 /NCGR_PEP_ID=MMETSP0725-20121227/13066_1 /TAXON_ID=265536 /ORGANISM="Amphiprora sp., Strain CCMP467" /LENGTH=76 /DNA_ID=CAMNT_0008840175 /DNA_START=143 /DNA_END=373 /DNA_ORIENTATION=+
MAHTRWAAERQKLLKPDQSTLSKSGRAVGRGDDDDDENDFFLGDDGFVAAPPRRMTHGVVGLENASRRWERNGDSP